MQLGGPAAAQSRGNRPSAGKIDLSRCKPPAIRLGGQDRPADQTDRLVGELALRGDGDTPGCDVCLQLESKAAATPPGERRRDLPAPVGQLCGSGHPAEEQLPLADALAEQTAGYGAMPLAQQPLCLEPRGTNRQRCLPAESCISGGKGDHKTLTAAARVQLDRALNTAAGQRQLASRRAVAQS